MGSTVSQKIWPQYMNTKDCTLGFCSLYCPQRCYFIFPPPPPFKHPPHESSSSTSFSPLMITTIIAILATAFLFAIYYTIISKFCGKIFSSTRTDNTQAPDMELGGVNEPPLHEPWFVSKNGLDEVLIRSIAAFKYKRGEGLIEGTDCSVCLSEFVEDESLKLLPKCSHAFHLQCIDAWLKCHSNCPLCRANVAVTTTSSALSLPLDSPRLNEPPSQSHYEAAEITANLEIVIRDQEFEGINVAKTPSRSVEIAIDQESNDEHMRRSLSMGEMNRHI